MVFSNCTSLIKQHFGGEKNAFTSDILVLCHNLDSFNPNLTSPDEFFNGFCCSNWSLTKLCLDFGKAHLKEKINLTCADRNSFDLNKYNLYTYLLLSICLPLGLVANSLILYAVLRHRCLPRPTGFFLCSLAIGDIGVILEFVSFVIYNQHFEGIPDRATKFLLPSFNLLFASVSLLQISVISIERAIAVSLPLSYSKLVTSSRARCSTLFVWAISFTYFTLSIARIPIKLKKYANFFFYLCAVTLLFVPMIVVLFCYAMVLFNAYQQLKQEKRRLKTLSTLMYPRISESKDMHRNFHKNMHLNRFKELKISANIAVIVLPFLCCWGFFTFVHVYEELNDIQFDGFTNWLVVALPFVVSSTNPIVYLLLTRSLREAVRSMTILKISKWLYVQESVALTSTMTKECDENYL